ncbi:MAG: VWA domain-containing protein [bacterium]|nr:VWA domain-containing protein [bacterium]
MYRVQTNRVQTSCAVVTVALLAAYASGPVTAEAPAADVVSQEIEVRLAELEVVVVDGQGEPVAGLTREDFEVLQDSQPVELTHFRSMVAGRANGVEAAAPPPGSPSPAAVRASPSAEAADRLHLVIYIDRGYLEPGDLKDVRQALKPFLRQALGPDDRVMLVTAGHRLELEQSFTTVPELVVSQLDDIRERPGGGRLANEYRSILQDMRRAKNGGTDIGARDPDMQARALLSQARAYAAEVNGELHRTTGQLQQLIQSIAGLPGRRAVLYVSGRVPAAYPRRLFDAWQEAFGRYSSNRMPSTPGAEGGGDNGASADPAELAQDSVNFDAMAAAASSFMIDAERQVQDVSERASSSGVVFHTLDAGGLRTSGFLAAGDTVMAGRGSTSPVPTVAPGSLADSLASLRRLAWDTGGRSFTGSRDFRAALSRIGSDFRTFYSLGFEPRESKDGTSRIKVRLRESVPGRGKLEVRHRPLIQLKDRDTLAAERTVSALLLEEMENPLEVVVSPGEPRAAGKKGWRVPVAITVPLARLALVADGRVHTGRLSIFTTAGGLDEVGPVTKAVVPVRIANRDLLTSLGRRVSYELELTLPSGLERIAVTVRDDFRPRSSTAVASWGARSLLDRAETDSSRR